MFIIVADSGYITASLYLKRCPVIAGKHGVKHDSDTDTVGLRTGIGHLVFDPDAVVQILPVSNGSAGKEAESLCNCDPAFSQIHGGCRDIIFKGCCVCCKNSGISVDINQSPGSTCIRISIQQFPVVITTVVGIAFHVSDGKPSIASD